MVTQIWSMVWWRFESLNLLGEVLLPGTSWLAIYSEIWTSCWHSSSVNYSSMHEETKRTLIAFWLGSEPLRKKESNSEERKHDSNLFYPNPTPTPLFLTPTPRWHSDDASSPTFTHPDSQIPIFFAEHELRWVNWCPNIDGIWPKPSPAWASSCRCDARLKNLLDYCTYVCKSDTKQYVLGDFGRWKHTFLYEFFFGKHSELKHRMQYSRPR